MRFEVKTGEGEIPEPPKTGRGASFCCLACGQPSDDKHIKAEGKAERMDAHSVQDKSLKNKQEKGFMELLQTNETL